MGISRAAATLALVIFEVWFGLALYYLIGPFIPFNTLGLLIASIMGIIILTTYGGVRIGCKSK